MWRWKEGIRQRREGGRNEGDWRRVRQRSQRENERHRENERLLRIIYKRLKNMNDV